MVGVLDEIIFVVNVENRDLIVYIGDCVMFDNVLLIGV